MKKQIFKSLMILSCLFTLTGLTAQAQSSRTSTADVPFDFSLGKQTLPAGRYEINQTGAGASAVLRIRDARGKNIALIPVRTAISSPKSQSEAHWIFSHYGDQYFLSEVWMGGEEDGLALPKTHVELQVAISLNAPKPTEVSVKLNRQ